jgi:hypothetical protein
MVESSRQEIRSIGFGLYGLREGSGNGCVGCVEVAQTAGVPSQTETLVIDSLTAMSPLIATDGIPAKRFARHTLQECNVKESTLNVVLPANVVIDSSNNCEENRSPSQLTLPTWSPLN